MKLLPKTNYTKLLLYRIGSLIFPPLIRNENIAPAYTSCSKYRVRECISQREENEGREEERGEGGVNNNGGGICRGVGGLTPDPATDDSSQLLAWQHVKATRLIRSSHNTPVSPPPGQRHTAARPPLQDDASDGGRGGWRGQPQQPSLTTDK